MIYDQWKSLQPKFPSNPAKKNSMSMEIVSLILTDDLKDSITRLLQFILSCFYQDQEFVANNNIIIRRFYIRGHSLSCIDLSEPTLSSFT